MIFNPKTDYDFRIYSNDRDSHITFTLEQYIHTRLPSLACSIDVLDNKFTGWNVDTWFSMDELIKFICSLEQGGISTKCSIRAMSPEDFTMSIERINRKGELYLTYSISTFKYSVEKQVRTTLTGGFLYNSEYLLTNIDDLKRLSSLTKLQANTDFRFDYFSNVD